MGLQTEGLQMTLVHRGTAAPKTGSKVLQSYLQPAITKRFRVHVRLVCMCVCVCMYVCVCMCACVRIRGCVCAWVHGCAGACVRACTCGVCVQQMYVHMYVRRIPAAELLQYGRDAVIPL